MASGEAPVKGMLRCKVVAAQEVAINGMVATKSISIDACAQEQGRQECLRAPRGARSQAASAVKISESFCASVSCDAAKELVDLVMQPRRYKRQRT